MFSLAFLITLENWISFLFQCFYLCVVLLTTLNSKEAGRVGIEEWQGYYLSVFVSFSSLEGLLQSPCHLVRTLPNVAASFSLPSGFFKGGVFNVLPLGTVSLKLSLYHEQNRKM